MCARKNKAIEPAPLPPVDEASVKQQPWAASLGWRAVRALASAGIASEDLFLGHKPSWEISYAARREIEKRQYEIRIERGLLDPAEPLAPEELEERLRQGGVLFEGENPFVSLGGDRAPAGKYYRLEGGEIWLANLAPEGGFVGELKGFRSIYHSPSQKTDKTYGIMRRFGFEERKFDVELTRKIYGMEFGALNELVVGYGRGLRSDISPCDWERVTCSIKPNRCNLTDNLIPGDFPYVAMEENMYWGAHVSIAAFYDHVKLLTGNADPRSVATKLMSEKGVSEQTWGLLKGTGNHGPWPHVRYDEVRDLLYR